MAISLGGKLKHDVTQSHPLAGCAFLLEPAEGPAELTMGRSSQCSITVPEPSVSDLHCSIQVTEQGVEVVDLGSKNGTSVNMKPLSQGETAVLIDEDILSLGRYSFQVMRARTLYSELKFLQLVER
jgi:pSer/pThr/pTyr-binding forkhead associated (FHA) protein